MRTLAQFGLYNMRGSDEATKMLVTGVIRTLAEEVGMPISSRALSLSWVTQSQYSCQSREEACGGCVYLCGEKDVVAAINITN